MSIKYFTDIDLSQNDIYAGKYWMYDGPNNNYGSLHFTDSNFHVEDADGHPMLVLEDGFMQIHKTSTIQSNLYTSALTTTRDHYLPNASGTLALTSDIPGISGTTNYVSKFTGANSLGNSLIFDNGTNVGIGTTSPLQKLHVEGLSYFASDIFTLNNGGIFFSGNNSYQRGIYSNSSGLTLQTLGSPKVTITDGGNVGIGTTSPYSKLDVTDYTAYLSLSSGINSEATSPNQQIGGIDFRKHYGLAIGTSIRQLQSGGVNNYSYAHLAFYTNNGEVAFGSVPPERMRITSEGNVGVGTTSPSAKLESYKGSQSDVISRANASAYFWGADIGLAIGQSQSSPFGTWIQSLKHDNNATFPLSLNPNGGNVGVGTVNPQRKLEVKGSHTTATFRVYYPDENVAGQDASVDIWASEPGISFNGSGIGSNVNGQPFYGRTNPALGQGFIRFIDGTTAFHNSSGDAAYAERMRITPGGNVGIGTTSPTTRLHTLVGNVEGLRVESSNSGFIEVGRTSGNRWRFSNDYTVSGALELLYGTSGAEPTNSRILIDSTGNVGIGLTNPSAKLNVNGTIKIEGNNPLYMGGGGSIVPTWGITPNGNNLEISGIATNTTGNVNFLNLGNVGIGTTTPQSALSIGTNHGTLISIGQPLWANNIVLRTSWDGSDFTQLLVPSNGANTAAITLRNSGNAGIGTISPSQRLHVAGNARITGAIFDSLNLPGLPGQVLSSTGVGTAWITGGGGGGGISGSGTTNYVPKFTGATSLGNSSIFDNGSAVGIFTSTPGFITSGRGVLSLNGANNSLIEFQTGGSFKSYLYQSGNDFEIYDTNAILFSVNGSERMRITLNGNVGIGTSSTIHTLSVAGRIGGNIFGDSHIEFLSNGNTSLKANNDVIIGYSQNTVVTQAGNAGIGTTTPDASAALDITSTTQGFLPPRMSESEMNSIPSPQLGLMVFNTDNKHICVFTGSWTKLAYV